MIKQLRVNRLALAICGAILWSGLGLASEGGPDASPQGESGAAPGAEPLEVVYLKISITGREAVTHSVRSALLASLQGIPALFVDFTDADTYADLRLWVQIAEVDTGPRKLLAISHVIVDQLVVSIPFDGLQESMEKSTLMALMPFVGPVMHDTQLSLVDAVDVLSWSTSLSDEVNAKHVPDAAARRKQLFQMLTGTPVQDQKAQGARAIVKGAT